MPGTWVNLAQPLFNGMPGAKAHGPARFWVDRHVQAHPGGTINVCITHMEMATHMGTHVDAARHFVPEGKTIDQYPMERFVGPGVVLDLRREGPVPVTADDLRAARPEIRSGDIVLLYFGYADHFRDPAAYQSHPYLTAEAAEFLMERRINILGVDTITPDLPGIHRPPGFDFPVHTRLLGEDILIIENLGVGLKRILNRRVTLAAVPFQIEGADASPITPLALVEGL